MDIELARTFLAIVEAGNFNKAAEQIHVTQSTVSVRIKSLEDQLGHALFVRSKAGTRLTGAGTLFRRYAETLVRTWEQARQVIALPPDYQGALSIGGQFTLWDRLLVTWIPWMRHAVPDMAIRAEVGLSEGLMRHLLDGLLDIAVMYTPQSRPGLVIEVLFTEDLVLASTDSAAASPYQPGYVYVDWGPEFRLAHGNAFPALEAPALTISHGPMALQYVLDNGGTGYFPRRLVRPHLDRGRLKVAESAPVFFLPAYVVYAEGRDDARFNTALQGLRYVASMETEA